MTTKTVDHDIDSVLESVLDELGRLTGEVAKLRGESRSRKEVSALNGEVVKLRNEIAVLGIDKSRLTEEHEREKREVQHFVGLEKKRQEVEMSQARREATLEVREANLEADKERFEKHIEFVEDRMGQHLADMKDLLTSVMDRIPTVSVDVVKTRPKS